MPDLAAAQTSATDTEVSIKSSSDVVVVNERSAPASVNRLNLVIGDDADGTVKWELLETPLGRSAGYAATPLTTNVENHHGASGDFQAHGGGKSGVLTVKDGDISGYATISDDYGKGIGVPIVDDALVEADEFFDIRLYEPTGDITFPGGAKELRQTVRIVDLTDDVLLTFEHIDVDEGEDARFELKLERALKAGEYAHATVWTNTDDAGTKASAADFEQIPEAEGRRVTWGPGQQVQTVSVPTTDDTADEVDEQFAFVVSNYDKRGVVLGRQEFGFLFGYLHKIATIIDDDPEPVMTASAPSIIEGDSGQSSLRFSVSLDRASEKETIKVSYSVRAQDSTAKENEDYTGIAPGTLTFSPGETRKAVETRIKGDEDFEADETILLRLHSLENTTFDTGGATRDAIGTIVDDDAPEVLTLTLHPPPAAVVEGEAAVFRAELDRPWVTDATVDWVTPGHGSARVGVDYEQIYDFQKGGNESVVIPAGQTSVELPVQTLTDGFAEGIEDFGVLLFPDKSIPQMQVPGGVAYMRVFGKIIDADTITVSARDAAIVTEGGDAVFTIELNRAAGQDVTVNWQTEDGTATDGVTGSGTEAKDYEPQTGQTLTIKAGDTRATVRAPTLQDDVDEGRETFHLKITSATGAVIDAEKAAAIIRDDDARPEISIADAPKVTEGADATFTVSLSKASERPVSMRWQTADGASASDKHPARAKQRDYKEFTAQTLTIPAGDLSATITVPTYDDTTAEYEESFRILLSHAPAGMLKDDEGVAAIADNDQPTVYVSRVLGNELRSGGGLNSTKKVVLDGGRIPESWPGVGGGLVVYFEIALSAPVPYEVSADWQILNGDEFGLRPANSEPHGWPDKPGDYDHLYSSKSVTFKSGETRKEINVFVYDDERVEDDEVFRLQLHKATRAVIDEQRDTGSVTIVDDDGITFFVPPGEPSVIREGGKITVAFERRPKDTSKLFPSFTDAGRRRQLIATNYRVCLFGGIENSVQYVEKLAPGRANVKGGKEKEGDDVFLTRANHGNFQGNHCRIFTDGGISSYVNIRFPEQTWRHTIEIQAIQDSIIEGDETVTLQFENSRGDPTRTRTPQSARVRHEITIIDDDLHRIRVEDATASEGDNVQFHVYVDPAVPAPAPGDTATVSYATIDGSAEDFKDYTAAKLKEITLTAPATATDPWATISVPTTEDELFEAEETFTLVLSNPSESFGLHLTGQHRATGTITDDDVLRVDFEDTVVDEGDKAAVTARISRAITEDVTVTWKTVSDTAEAPADYDAVSNGKATIRSGDITASVEVITKTDGIDEFDEDFEVQAVSVTPASVQIGAKAVVAIRDHDPGSVSFGAQADANVEENQAWSSGAPTLSGQPFGDVTWTKSGADAALFGIDADTGELSLPAQNYEKQADANKDNVYEVVVRATDEDGNAYVTDPPVKVAVTNVDTARVRLLTPYRGNEDENISLAMSRNEPDKTATLTLKWQTLADTEGDHPADENDYGASAEAQSLELKGNSVVTVKIIPLTDDDIDEPDETFRIRVFDLTDGVTDDAVFIDDKGAAVGSSLEAVATIADNDDRGVSISETEVSLRETDDASTDDKQEQQATYAVVLDSEPTDDVAINIGVPEGAPFTVGDTRLDFTPSNWSTAQTVTVTAVDDGIPNTGDARSARITHTVVPGDSDYGDVTAAAVAVTVNDDGDTPTVTLILTPAAICESGETVCGLGGATKTNTSTVTASMNSTSSQDVTLTVAAAPLTFAASDDFNLSSNATLTIPAGSKASTGTVTITAVDDEIDQAYKQITVSATASGGGGVKDPDDQILFIHDDDVTTVTLSAPEGAIKEDGGTKTITVALGRALVGAEGITAGLDFQGTATFGEDYELSEPDTTPMGVRYSALAGPNPTIEFTGVSNAASSATLTLTAINDDKTDEPDWESVDIGFRSVSIGTLSGGAKSSGKPSFNIINNEITPVISIDAPSVDEGESGANATLRFEVKLNRQSGRKVTVDYAELAGGTATQGTDYEALAGGSLTFIPFRTTQAGQTIQHIDITVTGDNIDEDNETVKVRLSSPSNATLSGGNDTLDGTGIITDDDTRGVTVSQDSLTIIEADTTGTAVEEHKATYTVVLHSEPTDDVTINIGVPDNAPFTVSPTSLTFLPSGDGIWSTAQEVTVTAVHDDIDNPDDARIASITHTVVAGNSDYGSVTADGVDVTVTDDDDAPTVSVANAAAVTEGNDPDTTVNMSFAVTLSAVSGRTVTVPYTLGGSATKGDDYTAPDPASLTIAAGSATANIVVPVKGDEIDEANETITVTLDTPTHATVSTAEGAGTATGTITDDDATPTGITLTTDTASIAESAATKTVKVTATVNGSTTYATDTTVQVTVGDADDSATSGDDYAAVTAFDIEIEAGKMSGEETFSLDPTDDALDEVEESISVKGASGALTITGATIKLTDNDTRGVTVTGASLTVLEADNPATDGTREDQATYTVALDSQPTANVTINITAGNAVTVRPTSLTFTPSGASIWSTEQTVTVTAVDDDIDNTGDARSARITHAVSAGDSDYEDETAANVDVTVTDDDGPPVISIDAPSVDEGASGASPSLRFTVSLGAASGKQVTVAYAELAGGTATQGTDYEALSSGTLTFAAGDTSKHIDLTVTGDDIDEDNETVKVRLSSPSNATLTGGKATLDATGTITDDDGAPTVSVANASAVSEGDDPKTTADMRFAVTLSAASSRTVTVPYTLGGTADADDDYTAPDPASLTIDGA